MYTRPRQSHEPIPSISTFSPYPSPSIIRETTSEDLTWYTPPETLLRTDSINPLPSPPYHQPLPPFPPPPPLHTLQPVPPRINKTNRKPHLPAEKNAALKAAKIAKDSQDLGPHTRNRFKCSVPGCNKFFPRRYNLKTHARVHTKEKPYTCPHVSCAKKFRWRSSLAHHVNVHNKRNPSKQSTPREHHISNLPPPQPQPLPLSATSVSYKTPEPISLKQEHIPRRPILTRQLPTSPISSDTPSNDRFQGFDLEHVPLAPPGELAMDELNFHHEHVTGMMFDNIM